MENDNVFKFLISLFIGALIVAVIILAFTSVAMTDEIAIQTIAREASNQPFLAQVAVAEVIKTRMAERNKTAKEVCLQRYQFDCWSRKQKPRTAKELAIARRAWESAKATGIDLYHDLSVNPYWTKKVTFVKQIGNLKFYREG